VDLTHSFPSVSGDAPMDYIPPYGFHHRPSRGWPPPNADDVSRLKEEVSKSKSKKAPTKQGGPDKLEDAGENEPPEHTNGVEGFATPPEEFLSVNVDGETVTIKDQIQVSLQDHSRRTIECLTTADVCDQSSSCASARQPGDATNTGWSPALADHGWRWGNFTR
jgi:hypothetical protein